MSQVNIPNNAILRKRNLTSFCSIAHNKYFLYLDIREQLALDFNQLYVIQVFKTIIYSDKNSNTKFYKIWVSIDIQSYSDMIISITQKPAWNHRKTLVVNMHHLID